MELFREYVGSLKKSRNEEETRRERRRVRRQERFLSTRTNREDRNRQILFRDIHTLSKPNTIAESELVDSVSQALVWWYSMCDHTIEHQLQCELAVQRTKKHEEDYLNCVLDHENKYSTVIFDTDARRWEEAKNTYLEAERQAQQEAVRDATNSVIQLTEQCISFLSGNGLENDEGGLPTYLDSNIIAQLVLDDEMWPKACEGDELVSTPCSLVSIPASKAFKAIFHRETPFGMTCSDFLQLLRFAYREDRNESCITRSFFDVSSLPIIALNGPKLSGKSLLAKYIVSHCGFCCVSDKDLVQKALDAYRKKSSTSPDSHADEEPPQTEEAWSNIGATLQDLLLRGDAVPFAAVVQMVHLQLKDLHSQKSSGAKADGAAGLLLDGIVTSSEIYQHLQAALLPTSGLLYEPLIQCWCGSLTESEQTQEPAEGDQVRNMLRMPKLPEELPTAREGKEKVLRRSVGASTLPPPTLPAVIDISEEVKREMTFIQKATSELADYASILTAIVQIECSPEELFRRFAGLRIDQENGDEYHMVYCPPPPSRAPFLVALERTQANAVRLADIVLQQQSEWLKMRCWLAMQSQPNLMSRVYEINGEESMEDIQGHMDSILLRIREGFIAAQKLFSDMRDSQSRVHALEEMRTQQLAEREAKRQQLITIYTEKGFALPAELQITAHSHDCNALDELKPPRGVCRVILKATQTFTLSYVNTYATAWKCLRSLAKQVTLYRKTVMEEMQRFMFLPDDKQRILDNFIRHFNGITPLMRSEITFKEEAHVMVEELADNLFKCVSETKKRWHQLIGTIIRRDAFMEGWESSLRNIGATLAQAETERFVTVVRLFTFFFNAQLGDEPVVIEEFDWDAAFASINTPDYLEGSVRIERKRIQNLKKPHPASTSTHVYGKAADDGSARSARDTFDEVLQRVVVALTNFVDRFRPASDSGMKNQKRSTTSGTARAEAFAAHCAPIIEAEMTRTLERLYCIRDFVGNMASQGEQYRVKMRNKMLEDIIGAVYAEASAVNTALYILRCCIEEESKAPRMHLGCGTFAVLDASGQKIVDPSQTNPHRAQHKNPSFITDVPLYQELPENTLKVHAGLTFGRLRYLIEGFAAVAPQYQLSKNDFIRFVREEDYDSVPHSPSSLSAAAVGTSGRQTKSTLALFQEFDVHQAGVIDWREFIVHLLFWCKPSTTKCPLGVFFIPEVTIEQLRDSKQALGDAPLEKDAFREKVLFFAKYLPEDRLEVYMEALWLTFRDEQTQTLLPIILLLFLCADVQLIRGAQKAICVSAQMTGETHELAVTPSELERAFHVLSTNPQALALYDPFSSRNIELLFASQVGAPTAISFRQMCGCLMGRMMLNGSSAFHRKSFTT